MPAHKIEAVIHDTLKDEAQKNALDFVAHLRANDIPLEESEGYWEVKYQDKCVCFLLITGSDEKPGPWTIWSDQEPGTWAFWPDGDSGREAVDAPVDERIRELAWANVNFCASCGGDCSPGKRKTILGKEFDGICSSTMAFTDPDAEALECAKKMVDIRKEDILKEVSPA
ncbi:MAG: hypothetical protein ACK5LX_13135 [Oscillospiraceae bacterium]